MKLILPCRWLVLSKHRLYQGELPKGRSDCLYLVYIVDSAFVVAWDMDGAMSHA